MAKKEFLQEARKLYSEGLSYELIAKKLNVSHSTILRWKRKDAGTPFDWDHLRYLGMLSQDSIENLNQAILAKFLDMLDTTIKEVYQADLSPTEKTKDLASLGDTFNKMISAMKKTTPEVAVAEVALKVLEIIIDTIKEDRDLSERFTLYLDKINERIIQEFSRA